MRLTSKDFPKSGLRAWLALPALVFALQACAQDAPAPAGDVAKPPAAAKTTAPAKPGADIPAEYAYVVDALPGVSISGVRPSPVDGLLEIAVGADVFYVSTDGKYFLQAEVMELESRKNLTDVARNKIRGAYLQNFSADTAVTFPAENKKYKVLVFTDIDCPYCRKLHREVAQYNSKGITVQYLFFPRSGPNTDSWAKAESVWCAESRQDALTASKSGEILPAADCGTTPVAQHYKLGKDLGIGGTPAIVTESGTLIVGYRNADELLVILEGEDAS